MGVRQQSQCWVWAHIDILQIRYRLIHILDYKPDARTNHPVAQLTVYALALSKLAGMSTAFSSSLFGLAGSLVLGFLDLQAGQAQNRFYNDLEEWLSTYTRLSGGQLGDGGEGSVPVYIQALLEQTADSLENLQRILAIWRQP